ncbi:hypothetical protein BMF94_6954 [Rhodotorula taiwanensis]|uniref:Uncharacterized protein n=1 Tax=Rhodotorula taiwanensis TaxID=741276 RepID=A0A2S5AZU2_9BASI|nr:hypothetical protein BMF94_6954 [Rhodotorula taiwanensis]
MSTAALDLPGFVYDPVRRRYFKATPSTAGRQTPAASAQTAQLVPQTRERHRQDVSDETPRQRKRGRAIGSGAVSDSVMDKLRNSHLAPWLTSTAARTVMKHDLQSRQMAHKLSSAMPPVYPDCLPMDDAIQHLSFDETDPATLRIGTSGGTIATGQLVRDEEERSMYPNDEQNWRTSWMCSSKITSLHTSKHRIVATCLGPPAQAIIGTTDDNISLASVTLSPRKTSLWSSAISRDLVVLGGDRSVLLTPLDSLSSSSSHPAGAGRSPALDSYTTGGRGGGGTVFALEIDEPGRMVWAGIRKGDVRGFDWRERRPSGGGGGQNSTHSEVTIPLGAPITHLRLIPRQPHQLLVAAMGGQLAIYDLRFLRAPTSSPRQEERSYRHIPKKSAAGRGILASSPAGRVVSTAPFSNSVPMPVVKMEGHENAYSTELGLDVWKDEWVAIAGQDSRLRIFSLRTGLALLPPNHPTAPASTLSTELTHPLARTFSGPIRSLAFSALDPYRLRESDYTRAILERDDERESTSRARWDCPSLWAADGPGVECFAVY